MYASWMGRNVVYARICNIKLNIVVYGYLLKTCDFTYSTTHSRFSSFKCSMNS